MNNTTHSSINFNNKFSKFKELWTPKILTQFDDYYIKAAKLQGEFVWHSHPDADELFVVISGTLKILFRNGEVTISPGECFVVPKGVEHKPVAEEEVCCLLIEKAGTLIPETKAAKEQLRMKNGFNLLFIMSFLQNCRKRTGFPGSPQFSLFN